MKHYINLCNLCNKKEKKEWRQSQVQKKPRKYSEYAKSYSLRIKNEKPILFKCTQMRSGAKKRADFLKLKHNISSQFLVGIAPEYCPILKIKLDYHSKNKGKNAPSLDRIDSKGGYTTDNVQIISYLANLMKSNATLEEMVNFSKWVLEKYS